MVFPNITGYYPSWRNIEVRLRSGRPLLDITAISYGDEIEEEIVMGAGALPRGRTRGRYKPGDGSITLLEPAFRTLISDMGNGWGDLITTITKTVHENSVTRVDVIEAARFLGEKTDDKESNDPLSHEIKMSYLRVKRDGKYLTS